MKVVSLCLCLLGPGFAAENLKTDSAPKREVPYATPMDLDSSFHFSLPVQDSATRTDTVSSAKPLSPIVKTPPSNAPQEDTALTKREELWILPLVVMEGNPGTNAGKHGADEGEESMVAAAVRLGASQNGEYSVFSAEETARYLTLERGYVPGCFSEFCFTRVAKNMGKGLVLGSRFTRHDTLYELELVLFDAARGKLRSTHHSFGPRAPDSLIPFARRAAECLLTKGKCSSQPMAKDSGNVIGWKNPRDSLDNRRRFGWAGSGMLVTATGLALLEGQLLQRDTRRNKPSGNRLSDGGARSSLRGFFAAPTLGARYAAMGGAGNAHVNNGLALLMNPAGVSQSQNENAVAAKRTLPGGTPSLFLAWAGPLLGKWSQGLGVQYDGDALASETTLEGALAYDLSELGQAWEGIKFGVELKLYLAEVGRSGTGRDRSTGHSVGTGLDIGLQAPVSDKLTAAFSIKDLVSILHHSNTLTDQSQGEVLPPEYRIGTAYRASANLLLLMDGQKGLFADQADHVRLGAEQILFQYFSIRGGLHQIFGREAVRKISVGFGINALPFGMGGGKGGGKAEGKAGTGSPLALNYAYEFALNEDEPLGGGQQFSLEMGF